MPLFKPFRLPGRWTRRRACRNRMAVQGLALAIVLVVILPAYVVYKPPKLLIGYFQARFPEVLFRVETSRKIIALTIDDAPSPFTEQILDILKANDAKATFFAIGDQIPERDFVLADIVRQGHELGNHAMHDEPSISLPSEVLTNEIIEVDKALYMAHQSAGKTRPNARYFRPGSGVFSRRILDVASKLGYQTILGSIYPHDPFIKYWRINAWHILSMAQSGAVIICHDRRSWTVPMLQKVLPELKKRGYEIVTVSGLLDVAHGT